jgi:MFS family permease
VPGAVAVLLIVLFVPADHGHAAPAAVPAPAVLRLDWDTLPPLLRRYLLILALFGLARTSESFILLRGHELGMTAVEVVLLWTWMCLMQTLSAAFGGPRVDRYRKSRLVRLSWIAYGVTFALIGVAGSIAGVWIAVAVYGLFTGAMEGVERALVSELAHEDHKGTAFGWYHMIGGLTSIPNGLGFGLLWFYAGAQWAFALAGALSIAAALTWWGLSAIRVQPR